jgi:hypothetical protein
MLTIFLPLAHSKAILGLLIGLISIMVCSGNSEARGERETEERSFGGAVITHTTFMDYVGRLTRARLVASQNNYRSNIKDRLVL